MGQHSQGLGQWVFAELTGRLTRIRSTGCSERGAPCTARACSSACGHAHHIDAALDGAARSLVVRDNGVGIDASTAGSGIGLSVMGQRARAIGAAVVLRANAKGGTEVALARRSHAERAVAVPHCARSPPNHHE